MPQILTPYQGTFIADSGLPTYSSPLYTVVSSVPAGGNHDPLEYRDLWLIWVTGSGAVNTLTNYRYTHGVGWTQESEDASKTPAEITTLIETNLPLVAQYISQSEASLTALDDYLQAQI